VSIQEGDAEVADFISRHALTYPFLMDRTGQISTTYKVTTTPTTYFIAPDGTIADVLAGAVNQRWLENNIDDYITS
jgi:peroxiredoxin